MKIVIKFTLALLLCVAIACEEDGVITGNIEGRLIPGVGVESADLEGVPVYLYSEVAGGDSIFLDSTLVSVDLEFSFSKLHFGLYIIGVDSNLVLKTTPQPLLLTQDSAMHTVVYEVDAIKN